jgi:hypothetical protein
MVMADLTPVPLSTLWRGGAKRFTRGIEVPSPFDREGIEG